jgi:hypothetical protein
MSRNHLVSALLAAAFTLTACGGGSSSQGVVPVGGGMQQSTALALQPSLGLGPANGYYPLTTPGGAHPVCPATTNPREYRCFAWVRTDLHPSLTQIAAGSKGIPTGIGFTATDIQTAYHLNPALGSGQTVYIIDAYGYKAAAKDLAVYRAAAGLPACGKSGSCFQILNQDGKAKPLPSAQNVGWDGEQGLDMDAVSAACPQCKIVLIQTNDNTTLGTGIASALGLGAKIISMSFGQPEIAPADVGLPMSGVALVASAGDNGGGPLSGGGPQTPCTYAAVVCVGGTALTLTGSARSEVTWNDEAVSLCSGPCGATGSACSTIVSQPSFEKGADCKMRAAADVSAVASPLTPFAIYSTPECGGWCGFGGTSLAAPLIAGVFGLAGNASTRHAATELWKSHSHLNDVTSGTNVYKRVTGKCASKVNQVCVAGKGYDGPTGWGTPNGSTDF